MLGHILVVLTTSKSLTLNDGSQMETGYDTFAFVEVLDHLTQEGFQFDIATLEGHLPHSDPKSLKHLSQTDQIFYQSFMEDNATLILPKSLSSLSEEKLHKYCAVFLPGGYAALEELRHQSELFRILIHFHVHKKPIGCIGGGCAALLQNTDSWPFKDYNMTCLNEAIESELEQHILHGKLPYHIGNALEKMGAHISNISAMESHTVEYGELITAQNHFSAYDFGKHFLKKIKSSLKIIEGSQ